MSHLSLAEPAPSSPDTVEMRAGSVAPSFEAVYGKHARTVARSGHAFTRPEGRL